jgi:hypothetical protein
LGLTASLTLSRLFVPKKANSPWIAIDRAGAWVHANLYEAANSLVASQYLQYWMATIPDKLDPVVIDHGQLFTPVSACKAPSALSSDGTRKKVATSG